MVRRRERRFVFMMCRRLPVLRAPLEKEGLRGVLLFLVLRDHPCVLKDFA